MQQNQARLNITINGQNGDFPDPVAFALSDTEIKRIAAEAIRTGYVPSIDPVAADLAYFVVDRFPATREMPARLMLRPKTPFGEPQR
jgi:hypothetical protein